ncbi:hypothetical protein RG963_00395 [Methanosarcina sp. Z-7115]|uniref:NPCBM-associated, NEW3 domain of alpha-galactosidase n=1 Tax=Methanosarcina baikalica TaxID=3073890 RepID=A0ABU2CWZ4_9EURY|nr:hypothetical protein [Methanosarcina sp. Z-7115]MDR7664263.1 hypothetical protein [Methanosarcina sp. Z-7115]
MRILDTKALKGIICGILAISIISIACAGAGNGDTAVSASEDAVQAKVGAGVGSSSAYAGDYFPEFEKIRVDPTYKYLQLEPGNSENFTVTVENKDNKTIELKPKPLITPYTENFINESWISISPSEKALKPGEKEEFEVKVSIPEDADLGNYAVLIAFTEKVPEGDVAGSYPNFPGTMQLNVQVWTPPVVQVLTPYVNDLVEAGKNYTYEIKLKNTGSKDISISPELTEGGGIIYAESASSSAGMPQQAFGNRAISVEAPDKIKAGQTAIVKLTLAVPADAKGSYGGSLDLNIDDPGIREYEGIVSLSFRILPVLKEPYENIFEAGTDGPITVEVKAYQNGYGLYTSGGNRDLTPSFNVSLKDPSGNEVTPTLVNTKYSDSINIIDDTSTQPYPVPYISSKIAGGMETYDQGNYQGGTTTVVKTYTAPGAVGKWKLSILPKNAENFEYSITIEAAEE